MLEVARSRNQDASFELAHFEQYRPTEPADCVICLRSIKYAENRASFFAHVHSYTRAKFVSRHRPLGRRRLGRGQRRAKGRLTEGRSSNVLPAPTQTTASSPSSCGLRSLANTRHRPSDLASPTESSSVSLAVGRSHACSSSKQAAGKSLPGSSSRATPPRSNLDRPRSRRVADRHQWHHNPTQRCRIPEAKAVLGSSALHEYMYI